MVPRSVAAEPWLRDSTASSDHWTLPVVLFHKGRSTSDQLKSWQTSASSNVTVKPRSLLSAVMVPAYQYRFPSGGVWNLPSTLCPTSGVGGGPCNVGLPFGRPASPVEGASSDATAVSPAAGAGSRGGGCGVDRLGSAHLPPHAHCSFAECGFRYSSIVGTPERHRLPSAPVIMCPGQV